MFAKLGERNTKTEKHFGLGGPGPWKEPVVLKVDETSVTVSEKYVTVAVKVEHGAVVTTAISRETGKVEIPGK